MQRDAKRRAEFLLGTLRHGGIGEEGRQFGDERIIERGRAETSRREQAIAIDNRQHQGIGQPVDGIALGRPRTRLEP